MADWLRYSGGGYGCDDCVLLGEDGVFDMAVSVVAVTAVLYAREESRLIC